ncbi:hypothetical protein [Campylobacter concisus]|uniref:hypothetical protein n=1 Tax=Campylobacter concisus TaxID=199 RepID=UPI000D3A9AD6|nr:hypothetical protein [Campylobacter concisus]
MIEQPELTREMITSFVVSVIVIIFIVKLAFKAINAMELWLKVLKIRRLAKKTNLDNYTLKTNEKGMPVLLVHRDSPDKIFII